MDTSTSASLGHSSTISDSGRSKQSHQLPPLHPLLNGPRTSASSFIEREVATSQHRDPRGNEGMEDQDNLLCDEKEVYSTGSSARSPSTPNYASISAASSHLPHLPGVAELQLHDEAFGGSKQLRQNLGPMSFHGMQTDLSRSSPQGQFHSSSVNVHTLLNAPTTTIPANDLKLQQHQPQQQQQIQNQQAQQQLRLHSFSPSSPTRSPSSGIPTRQLNGSRVPTSDNGDDEGDAPPHEEHAERQNRLQRVHHQPPVLRADKAEGDRKRALGHRTPPTNSNGRDCASSNRSHSSSPVEGLEHTQEEVELLRENVDLRKQNARLMKDNMKLIVELKEKEHVIFKQNILIGKYRKKFIKIFEDTTASVPGRPMFQPALVEPIMSESDEENEDQDPVEEEEANEEVERVRGAEIINSLKTKRKEKGNDKPKAKRRRRVKLKASASSTQEPFGMGIPIGGSMIPQRPQSLTSSNDRAPTAHNAAEIESAATANVTINGFGMQPMKKDKERDKDKERSRRKGRRSTLWTPEDDEKFFYAYNLHGKSWKAIHAFLPDKTREQVQSHGQYLIRIGKIENVGGKPRSLPAKTLASSTGADVSSDKSDNINNNNSERDKEDNGNGNGSTASQPMND